MTTKSVFIVLVTTLCLWINSSPALARTTCEVVDGKIVITLYIAFEGASEEMVQHWAQEIVDVWNGPSYQRTYGDCGCPVVFDVKTRILRPGEPWPVGWHYIAIVEEGLPRVKGPNNESAIAYIGRTLPSPPPLGLSVDGEWAAKTSYPVPGAKDGERFKHAAHEAGHLMGLCDDYSEANTHIMGRTSGPYARPTPEQIREIIHIVTGKDACPLCAARKAAGQTRKVPCADQGQKEHRRQLRIDRSERRFPSSRNLTTPISCARLRSLSSWGCVMSGTRGFCQDYGWCASSWFILPSQYRCSGGNRTKRERVVERGKP